MKADTYHTFCYKLSMISKQWPHNLLDNYRLCFTAAHFFPSYLCQKTNMEKKQTQKLTYAGRTKIGRANFSFPVYIILDMHLYYIFFFSISTSTWLSIIFWCNNNSSDSESGSSTTYYTACAEFVKFGLLTSYPKRKKNSKTVSKNFVHTTIPFFTCRWAFFPF